MVQQHTTLGLGGFGLGVCVAHIWRLERIGLHFGRGQRRHAQHGEGDFAKPGHHQRGVCAGQCRLAAWFGLKGLGRLQSRSSRCDGCSFWPLGQTGPEPVCGLGRADQHQRHHDCGRAQQLCLGPKLEAPWVYGEVELQYRHPHCRATGAVCDCAGLGGVGAAPARRF